MLWNKDVETIQNGTEELKQERKAQASGQPPKKPPKVGTGGTGNDGHDDEEPENIVNILLQRG